MLALFALTGCASQATFGDAITQGEPTAIPTPVVPSKPVYQVERGKIVYERRFFGRITPWSLKRSLLKSTAASRRSLSKPAPMSSKAIFWRA